MTSTRSAILFGATGAVGKPLLSELLKSSEYDQIHTFVRKPFKAESNYKDEGKLVEHLIDFEKLLEEQKGSKEIHDINAKAIYITLGTTRANAGSAQAFERIDREYVLAAGKAALNQEKEQNDQKILYCSSFGVSSKSPLLYPKSKGLTEEGLGKFTKRGRKIEHPIRLLNDFFLVLLVLFFGSISWLLRYNYLSTWLFSTSKSWSNT